jgi:hypothetical protein
MCFKMLPNKLKCWRKHRENDEGRASQGPLPDLPARMDPAENGNFPLSALQECAEALFS